MAFPTTGILDDFNRADEGPPPSANWTNQVNGTGTGQAVVSNQCKNVASGLSSSWWNVATFTDSEVYYDLASTRLYTYLYVRLHEPGSSAVDGYVAYISTADATIYRWDNNSFTQLGSTTSVTYSVGDTMGFEANGTTLTVYKKTGGSWTSSATYTGDTTYASGYIGCGVSSDVIIDNFGGGTIVVAGPPVNTVAPAVTGTVQVGQTLSCDVGTWTG